MLRIQQMMSKRIMQEQRTDDKIKLLNIINELTNAGSKRAQTEAVLIEASQNNIPESEVLRLFDELEADHLIRQTRGFIERT